ncbi:PrsW family intramembrane metalloprotease [Patescibacteria group bacterium]
MKIAILILLSLLPVALLLLFFEKQDKGRKDPLKLKWKVFLWGILITILAGFIEVNLDGLFHQFIADNILYFFVTAFVTAAIIEEVAKYLVVRKVVYNNKNFDEVMDGINYTIIASLGFAALENVLYVVSGGYVIAIIRALLSVPAHALFSGIMGYYIGVSRFFPGKDSPTKVIAKGLFLAIFYHGLFNFLLMTESPAIVLVIPLMVFMGLHLKYLIGKAQFLDKNTKKQPEKLTVGHAIRIFIGCIFLVVGAASIAGSIMLVQDNVAGYGTQDIYTSIGFALVLALISYLIMKKYRKKA